MDELKHRLEWWCPDWPLFKHNMMHWEVSK